MFCRCFWNDDRDDVGLENIPVACVPGKDRILVKYGTGFWIAHVGSLYAVDTASFICSVKELGL